MKHFVEPDTYQQFLLHIDIMAQAEPDLDFSCVDTESHLLPSIEEVRDEVRRRYHDATKEPLYEDTENRNGPQVGWVYGYEGPLSTSDETKSVLFQDQVRVYHLQEETVAPEQWEPVSDIKESHLEEELTDALQTLLECTELNMDAMEPETREVIVQAQRVLDEIHPKQ